MTPAAAANWAAQAAKRSEIRAAVATGAAQGLTPAQSVQAAQIPMTGNAALDNAAIAFATNNLTPQTGAVAQATQAVATTSPQPPASWMPWAIGGGVVGGGIWLLRTIHKHMTK